MVENYTHFIIIISGPSGVGKSTITKMILNKYTNIKLSISATTRNPRDGEIEGVSYYFISHDDFDLKVKNEEFFEYARHYGNSYGTLKSEIDKDIKNNDILLDIDWKGKNQVLEKIKDKSEILTIFILPPSIEELEKRLRDRKTDSEEKIKMRLDDVKNTINHAKEYEYTVINDDINKVFNEICSIIDNKRLENKI